MHYLPTGTVTFLFTDIEGSTRLLQQLGDGYSRVLEECRRLLRSAFQEWNGHEVDTQGDAFFVAFARATDAVSAAVDGLRALAVQSWPEDVAMNVGRDNQDRPGFFGSDKRLGNGETVQQAEARAADIERAASFTREELRVKLR